MVWRKMQGYFLTDEEMGKKDDDHKLSAKNGGLRGPKSNWQAARGPLRRSFKRVAALVAVAVFVYLFVHNIPTNIGPRTSLRPIYKVPESAADGQRHSFPPERPPQSNADPPHGSSPPERTYNGPPRYNELGISLRAIGATKGGEAMNRNILFAASSLKSAATLLPIACQMGLELRNYVHFAFTGRSEIDLVELQKVNGIDVGCHIIFHDARPTYASISTDSRMESSVFRAFYHINKYMHPQAIIVDVSGQEDDFFKKGARSQSKVVGGTLIELPELSANSLAWITKLDSSSLRVWDKHHIDILIHVSPGASGSLIRLLKSLSKADYTASSIPHLTIELPHGIDPPTKRFLETFKWPPERYNPTNARYLSLRHRIPSQRMTEEQSSTRFLESFWPANPQMSHILVLSPEVELSPQFFHYLRYSLLEYKYSASSRAQRWDDRLIAISLEQPLLQLDGETKFSPPTIEMDYGKESATSFLWQAPSSNAVLFIGEKWMELHDLMFRSLEAQQRSSSTPALLSEKVVSTRQPSWVEYVLRLSRARGYLTLYPGEETAKNLATVHNELRHLPEEYADLEPRKEVLADDATETEIEKAMQRFKSESEIHLAPIALLQGLPDDGALTALGELPLLTWEGEKTDNDGLYALTMEYALEFKSKVGSCAEEHSKKERAYLSTEDLFCATD